LKKEAKQTEFSEYPSLTDLDYDASDVQIQFADQNLDKVNDELAEFNNIK